MREKSGIQFGLARKKYHFGVVWELRVALKNAKNFIKV